MWEGVTTGTPIALEVRNADHRSSAYDHLADVYRPLVREGMAAALVSHNHPSGEPTPSEPDRELTYRMAQVGNLLGIPLLDHVVVAHGGHYSFAEHGHLESPLTLPPPMPNKKAL